MNDIMFYTGLVFVAVVLLALLFFLFNDLSDPVERTLRGKVQIINMEEDYLVELSHLLDICWEDSKESKKSRVCFKIIVENPKNVSSSVLEDYFRKGSDDINYILPDITNNTVYLYISYKPYNTLEVSGVENQ